MSALFAHCWWWYPETKIHYFSIRIPPCGTFPELFLSTRPRLPGLRCFPGVARFSSASGGALLPLYPALFFAYAPTNGVTYAAPAVAGWPGFTYTVAAEASQADLVVAQRTSQDATSNNGSVALNFNHALSQILFSAKCANADFTAVVKTIELSGIQNAGTYTYATSASEGTAIEGAWSSVSGTASYAYLTNGTAAIAKTTSDPIAGTNGALMLMPQALTGAKLKVVYSVTLGTGETAQTFDVTKENVELKGTWAPGMKYTYDLTLVSDAKQITLDPSVKPWTEGTITDQPSL